MQTLMHILKFLWRGLGNPGVWLVLLAVIMITDAIAPSTLGRFWFALLMPTFYCLSIATTRNKILQKPSTKQE